jgi:outer membrane protein assembly factor BamB
VSAAVASWPGWVLPTLALTLAVAVAAVLGTLVGRRREGGAGEDREARGAGGAPGPGDGGREGGRDRGAREADSEVGRGRVGGGREGGDAGRAGGGGQAGGRDRGARGAGIDAGGAPGAARVDAGGADRAEADARTVHAAERPRFRLRRAAAAPPPAEDTRTARDTPPARDAWAALRRGERLRSDALTTSYAALDAGGRPVAVLTVTDPAWADAARPQQAELDAEFARVCARELRGTVPWWGRVPGNVPGAAEPGLAGALVGPYVAAPDLDALRAGGEVVSAALALRITEALAGALARLAADRRCHGGLTPGAVLLTGEGPVVAGHSVLLPLHRAVAGTPFRRDLPRDPKYGADYRAPEASAVPPRSGTGADVYALGCLIGLLVSCVRPEGRSGARAARRLARLGRDCRRRSRVRRPSPARIVSRARAGWRSAGATEGQLDGEWAALLAALGAPEREEAEPVAVELPFAVEPPFADVPETAGRSDAATQRLFPDAELEPVAARPISAREPSRPVPDPADDPVPDAVTTRLRPPPGPEDTRTQRLGPARSAPDSGAVGAGWTLALDFLPDAALAAYAGPGGTLVLVAGTDGERGRLVAVRPEDGAVCWEFGTATPCRARPAVDGDRVLLAERGGRLHCLDAATGRPWWTVELDADGLADRAPAPAADRVWVAGLSGRLFAVPLDGREVRAVTPPGEPADVLAAAPLAAPDGGVWLPTVTGLHRLDAQGRPVWRQFGGHDLNGLDVVRAGGRLHGFAAAPDGGPAHGPVHWSAHEPVHESAHGSPQHPPGDAAYDLLYACDADTGEALWTVPFPDPAAGPPQTAGGAVFAAGADGLVAAFDAANGAVLWRTGLGAPAAGPLAVAGAHGELLVVCTRDRRAHALHAADGSLRWTAPTGGRVGRCGPLALGGLTLLGASDCHLYAFAAHDGTGGPIGALRIEPEIDALLTTASHTAH